MPTAQKFMFDRIFEDPNVPLTTPSQVQEGPEEEEAEPEEVIPTFSAEELEAARKEGFQAGKEEGLNASLDSIERQVSATVSNIENAIVRLVDEQKNANEELSHLALSVAVSISRKMLPELASRHALDEIEHVIIKALPRLVDEPLITIRIHGNVETLLNSRIEPLRAHSGFAGIIVVKPDKDIEIGDCRLEWSCGGAERNTTALWRDIDAIIARNFDKTLLTPPDEPEDMPSADEKQALDSGELAEAQQEDFTGVPGTPKTNHEDVTPDELQATERVTESSDSIEIADVSENPDLPPTADT